MLGIRIHRIRMVFGPPGSGSISQRYGSGYFTFLIKVLIGRKKCLQNKFFFCKTEDNVPAGKLEEKKTFLASLKSLKKGVGSGVGSGSGARSGYAQDVTDPQQ